MTNYKQAILVRNDLKLPKGKLAAQVAHASVEATLKSDKETIEEWRAQGMQKVVLKVENLDDLKKYQRLAKEAKIRSALITDAGHTVVEPGTTTCLAIGPAKESEIDKVCGNLKLL